MITKDFYEQEHRALGCQDCKYADKKALFHGPCCTYVGIVRQGKEGECLSARTGDEE